MNRALVILAAVAIVAVLAVGIGAFGARAESAPLLRSQVVVSTSVVTLGDLFDGLGAEGETAIARAPEPGQQVEVSAYWLAAVAQAHGLPWRPRSALETALISRESQTIAAETIRARLREALAERGLSGEFALQLDRPLTQLHLPSDAEPTLAISTLAYDHGSGRFAATLVSPAEGRPIARLTTTGRAVEITEIPVPNRRIEAGQVIRADDLEWVKLRAGQIGRNALVSADALIGKAARRPLRAGESVRTIDVETPVLVTKNSLVTIRLASGRLQLTTQGRALDEGGAGDIVRVMNTSSNKIVEGVVVQAGTVIVEPLRPLQAAAN